MLFYPGLQNPKQYTRRQIQYLVAAAEHGNHPSAAVPHVSRSSVSSTIAREVKSFLVQFPLHHQAKGSSFAFADTHIVAKARSLLVHASDFAG